MKRLIRNCFLVQNPIRIIGMVVLDALLLTMTFCADLQDHPAASVIYALSVYVLVAFCIWIIREMRTLVNWISKKAFCRRWHESILLRDLYTKVFG